MSILVIGGGICGLGTALLLARDGHPVTVLERDPAPPPDSLDQAWHSWQRSGVPQFRQPHNFMPGLRMLLEADLPDVHATLGEVGASRYDLLQPLPPSLRDHSPRDIDDQLWTFTARRPVGEWVFADAVRREPLITVRRGVAVRELLTGAPVLPGTPHVTGVRTTDGEALPASLVVDATGRQSPAPAWLAAIGARPPVEDQADSGFIYYTRYFRGETPARIAPVLSAVGTISLLTLQADNGVWSVTIFTASGDQPLKALRHEPIWTNVVRAHPLHAHWLAGEPITGILAMGGIVDRLRRLVRDGTPIVTGFVAVADAYACTNPSAGRGLTVGFLHGRELRDTLRDSDGDPRIVAGAFDARAEAAIRPWYDAQIAVDRARFAEMTALREGSSPPPPEGLFGDIAALLSVMTLDPDLFRAALEYIGTITPIQTILARPDLQARIASVRATLPPGPPPRLPGPSRQELLTLVQ